MYMYMHKYRTFAAQYRQAWVWKGKEEMRSSITYM
jgi:hypothetical protein